jgi:hypothetical protein
MKRFFFALCLAVALLSPVTRTDDPQPGCETNPDNCKVL